MYPELHLLIDGDFLARDGEPVMNPATAQSVGTVPHATTDDLDQALAAADKAFDGWRRTTPVERGAILRKAAELLRERSAEISLIMTMEQGKPLGQSQQEVATAAAIFDWNAEEARRTYGRIIPGGASGTRQMVILEPVGVSLAFTPWNFPALTPARKIGAALAAGCTMVLKASEETPGTAVAIARALVDAGLPKGVLNLVFGDPAQVSSWLIASPAARKVSFTGSTAVGKQLVRQAADGMLRTTMELGGHAPVLVFEDADPEVAATYAAMGKFFNAGQVCISPTRFYVHEAVYDRFVDRFLAVVDGIKVGDGTEDDVTMGPLANSRRLDAMEALVADSVAHGGNVRAGGNRLGNAGFFFQPTVVTDLPDDCRLMTEEPFGPIAPITRFSAFDDVIARANSLPFGLASYAFTTSSQTATAVGDALKAGMVGINTLSVSAPETPFGGVRESGHGQEGGSEGIMAYLDVKYIAQA